MIAVTFALPHESQDFRRALHRARKLGRHGAIFGELGAAKVLVVHTGVGSAAAAARTRTLLAEHRPECLLGAGYAGGLDPALQPGELFVATNFSNAELIERCRKLTAPGRTCHFGLLTTQDHASETSAAKSALAQTSGAQAVDMETSAIANAAQTGRIPFLSVRVISDSATQNLPVPLAVTYDFKKQRPRPGALTLHLLRHPGAILPFTGFVRQVGRARRNLTQFLIELIRESVH